MDTPQQFCTAKFLSCSFALVSCFSYYNVVAKTGNLIMTRTCIKVTFNHVVHESCREINNLLQLIIFVKASKAFSSTFIHFPLCKSVNQKPLMMHTSSFDSSLIVEQQKIPEMSRRQFPPILLLCFMSSSV
jgi:hypothetical protein